MTEPLTGSTTPGARGMAASLLKYANREAVAQALTERGYTVSRATVNRWAGGKEMPDIAARMIAELFGHADTTKSAPDYAEALRIQMTEIATKLDAFDEWHRLADEREQGLAMEAATQGAVEAVRLFLAENGIRLVRDGEPDPSPAAGDPQSR